MGSSGQKSRKNKKSKGAAHSHNPQHLSQQNPAPGSKESMHLERQGAMDAMGIGGMSPGVRTAIIVIVVLFFIGAIAGLLILNTL
jgi:hypothetical protein